jgi:hemerythrin-like metal-binding protein
MTSKEKKTSSWTYEALPYLYMGSAILVALSLPNVWGAFSGLMLLVAGIVVWWMRRRHRQALKDRQALRKWHAQQGFQPLGDTSLVAPVWRPEYECGHPVIDTQHRNLFSLGVQLLHAIQEGQTKLDVELLFDELLEKVAQHFTTEETVMATSDSDSGSAHRELHRLLLERSRQIADRYHNDQLKADELYAFVAEDILAGHIITSDLKDMRR